ncbi:MAG: DUF4258 domain-containing protein [Planctomycetes bacterium]|nr:DUF4258 domain-containing protein [Planctomycetota bacterium]
MRELIRTGQYIATTHALDEMEADSLIIFDVEHCILAGRIRVRQKDRVTAEWKYVVEGPALDRKLIHVVAKIGPTGKLVIITAYRL